MSTKILVVVGVIVVVLAAVYFLVANQQQEGGGIRGGEVRVPTSADNAPPGSIHNLPVPDAVAAVRTRVAQEQGVDEGLVIIMTAYERDWSDACLGLAAQDEMCAQVITPGFEVTAQVSTDGSQFSYRTNADGSVLRRITTS